MKLLCNLQMHFTQTVLSVFLCLFVQIQSNFFPFLLQGPLAYKILPWYFEEQEYVVGRSLREDESNFLSSLMKCPLEPATILNSEHQLLEMDIAIQSIYAFEPPCRRVNESPMLDEHELHFFRSLSRRPLQNSTTYQITYTKKKRFDTRLTQLLFIY